MSNVFVGSLGQGWMSPGGYRDCFIGVSRGMAEGARYERGRGI